ncbi:MAG: hypothetical protein ACOY5U_16185 [Pseudomonadota bacterium]
MKRAFIALAVLAATTSLALAEGKHHKVAIHVDQNDPAVLNMALNNVQNLASYYKSQGDTVDVEVVAYGPGLVMYTADSPVKDRFGQMHMEMDNLAFAACGNSLAGMEKKAGKTIDLIP